MSTHAMSTRSSTGSIPSVMSTRIASLRVKRLSLLAPQTLDLQVELNALNKRYTNIEEECNQLNKDIEQVENKESIIKLITEKTRLLTEILKQIGRKELQLKNQGNWGPAGYDNTNIDLRD